MVVDDIFDLIKSQINLKALQLHRCDEHYKRLYETKNELQLQIDSYKCNINEKIAVPEAQEDSLIELCCKYLEIFFAILHFRRIRSNKILEKKYRDMTPVRCWICNTEVKPKENRCRICYEIVRQQINKENSFFVKSDGKQNINDIDGDVDIKVIKESKTIDLKNEVQCQKCTNSSVVPPIDVSNKPIDQKNSINETISMKNTIKLVNEVKLFSCTKLCREEAPLDVLDEPIDQGKTITEILPMENCDIKNIKESKIKTSKNEVQYQHCKKPPVKESPINVSGELVDQKKTITETMMKRDGDINEIDSKLETMKKFEIFEILLKNMEKWVCSVCTCHNTFDNICCEVCNRGIEDVGTWICGQCYLVNTEPFDCCSNCGRVNQNFKGNPFKKTSKSDGVLSKIASILKIDKYKNEKVGNVDGKSMPEELFMSGWNSSKFNIDSTNKNDKQDTPEVLTLPNLGMSSDEDNIKCGDEDDWVTFHKRSRSETKDRRGDVLKKEESWRFKNCNLPKKNDKEKTEMCNFDQSDMIFVPNNWKCWNKNCGQFNEQFLDFCQHCRLIKYSSYRQDDIVKYQDKTGVKDIWVCRNCYKFNNISDYQCKGKRCGINRS